MKKQYLGRQYNMSENDKDVLKTHIRSGKYINVAQLATVYGCADSLVKALIAEVTGRRISLTKPRKVINHVV